MGFQRQGENGSLHWIIFFAVIACVHMSQLVLADNFGSWTVNGIKISRMDIHNAAVSINEHGMRICNSHNAAVTVNARGVTISNINNAAITVNDDGITISSKTGSPKDEKEQEKPEDPTPEEAEKENSALHDKTPEEANKDENSAVTVEELGGDKEDNNGADKVKGGTEEEKTNGVAQEAKEDTDEEANAVSEEEEEGEEEVRTRYKNFGTIHYEIRNNKGDLTIGKYINYGLIHVNLHDNKGNIDIKIRNGDDKARVFIHCHRNKGTIRIFTSKQGRTEIQTVSYNEGSISENKLEAQRDQELKGKYVEREFYGTQTIAIDSNK